MKKMYITPAVEIHKTQVGNMMALSFKDSGAPEDNASSKGDPSVPGYSGDALVKEWNIWDE